MKKFMYKSKYDYNTATVQSLFEKLRYILLILTFFPETFNLFAVIRKTKSFHALNKYIFFDLFVNACLWALRWDCFITVVRLFYRRLIPLPFHSLDHCFSTLDAFGNSWNPTAPAVRHNQYRRAIKSGRIR